MERVIERYKTKVDLEPRVKDGKCAFCGQELTSDYCDCSTATLKNRYYKKFNNKLAEIMNISLINSDLKDVQNKYLSNFKTPKNFQGYTFESYKIESESERIAFNTAIEYFYDAINHYLYATNLIFLGNFGTGKTMLMSILCNALAKEYLFNCQYVNMVDFYNKITNTFNSKDVSVQDVINRYKNAEFLFLDDIDKIKPSDFIREIFYALINYRVENELPIIISANHNLEELDSKYYDEAIVSRLVQNAQIVNFSHKNRRFAHAE